MASAEFADRRRVEDSEANLHVVWLAQHRGDGLEALPGQAQFAGTEDLRMAGEHLLGERGAGARQAEVEHRQRMAKKMFVLQYLADCSEFSLISQRGYSEIAISDIKSLESRPK